MKRVIFILITSLYFSKAYATFTKSDSTKKDTTKKHLNIIVKADILLPVFGLYAGYRYCSFTIEKLLKKRHSVQVTFTDYWEHTFNGLTFNNWQLIPEYKFFVSNKKSHGGYYVGAFGLFVHSKYVTTFPQMVIEGYKTISLGGGISNGAQFYLFKKLTIDVLVGVGLIKPVSYYDSYLYYNGVVQPLYYPDYDWQSYVTYRVAINIGF
ncbi:MAG TPA: DUF3575 domain-containing protein [Bacteroidia bacterium]